MQWLDTGTIAAVVLLALVVSRCVGVYNSPTFLHPNDHERVFSHPYDQLVHP